MRFVPPPEATQGVDSPYLGPVTHIVLGPYEGGSLDWTEWDGEAPPHALAGAWLCIFC
jgi:hypothetical protein